ncbi:MAG: transglycosylase SLT domain-containing protein, partial [Pseudomonadales bacterium]|nr:transglycosylase SLT domain-containing protein [Pseudomonadales bacterium]
MRAAAGIMYGTAHTETHAMPSATPTSTKHRDLATRALPLLMALMTSLNLLTPQAGAQSWLSPARQEQLQTQRQSYLDALDALARRDRAGFDQRRAQLLDYPLRPYLDYSDLSTRLDRLPVSEVHAFLASDPGSVLALRLQRQWLQTLAAAGQWQQFLTDYDPEAATTELNCQALYARLQAGDASALTEVAGLWNVPWSQPNICDPLFAAWRAAGHLSPDLMWARFSASLQAGQDSLATYLSTLMPPREKALATLWLDTLKQPQALRDTARYADSGPELLELLPHALRRLAQSDAPLAWDLTQTYTAQHSFPAASALDLRRYIVQRLLTQGYLTQAEMLLRADPALPSDTLVEWLLRDAMAQQDWQRFDAWLPLLSPAASAGERWRYWRARSLARRIDPDAKAQAQALFSDLAQTRSFYGFLSADLIGQPYAMVDRPLQIPDTQLTALLDHPAMARAVELFLVHDETNALREWQQAMSTLSTEEVLAAGKLAQTLNWYRNGITALSQAAYWDDLDLRFPFAYRDLISAQASQNANLDGTFIYGVVRQESAFIDNARSSSGALGLMQLMPGTANDMARASGLSPRNNQQILEPSTNLRLGSRYLAQMLQNFDGNRILAAAAYNAGPARVRQWRAQTAG